MALTQTRMVVRTLQTANPDLSLEIRAVTTRGDRATDAPLTSFGGEGVFVREIEQALLSGEIDAAVHSLKDLPVTLPEGLILAGIPERADVRDALVCRAGTGLDALPPGARMGTGSPRRQAQLLHIRPDIRCLPVRGNIDTRLRKLMETDELDAILLACAGLDRLGWADRITERLPLERFLPAPGQGALAVETRADDTATREAVWRIDHTPTRQSVTAERSFLKHTGGGCHTPVAAWGRLTETGLTLEGLIASPDGRDLARDVVSGNPADAEYLGERLAQKLTMDRNTSRSSS